MANELILIVEDNEKNRRLARDILQVKGYRTIEAETAESGLEMAPKENPDLVLMDIQLPGMNGIQALKRLRESEATRAIPVLAFTASVMPQDRREIMDAGFDGFVAKPVNLKEFIAAIAKALGDEPAAGS
ncbi:MAG: response regulator [Betaproteobacteria bacterium]|nr:MAG: response regulator [Betaproteobacteria bacterium]